MLAEVGYETEALAMTVAAFQRHYRPALTDGGIDAETADSLAKLGEKVRNLKEHGLSEGVSTRLLIYAGRLMEQDISARRACQVAVVWALTDDVDVQRSIEEVVSAIFE